MPNDFDVFLNSIKYLDKEDILATAYKKHKALDKSTTQYTLEYRLNLQKAPFPVCCIFWKPESGRKKSAMKIF